MALVLYSQYLLTFTFILAQSFLPEKLNPKFKRSIHPKANKTHNQKYHKRKGFNVLDDVNSRNFSVGEFSMSYCKKSHKNVWKWSFNATFLVDFSWLESFTCLRYLEHQEDFRKPSSNTQVFIFQINYTKIQHFYSKGETKYYCQAWWYKTKT